MTWQIAALIIEAAIILWLVRRINALERILLDLLASIELVGDAETLRRIDVVIRAARKLVGQ